MATTSKAGDKPVKPAAKTVATKPKATKSEAAPKAVAEKKSVTAKAPAKKAATAQAAVPAQKTVKPAAEKQNAVPLLTHDQRRYYVEVAAYYIAERRGFHGGSVMDDWVRAESEIDRLVREGILKP